MFIPDPIHGRDFALDGETVAAVAEATRALQHLDHSPSRVAARDIEDIHRTLLRFTVDGAHRRPSDSVTAGGQPVHYRSGAARPAAKSTSPAEPGRHLSSSAMGSDEDCGFRGSGRRKPLSLRASRFLALSSRKSKSPVCAPWALQPVGVGIESACFDWGFREQVPGLEPGVVPLTR